MYLTKRLLLFIIKMYAFIIYNNFVENETNKIEQIITDYQLKFQFEIHLYY